MKQVNLTIGRFQPFTNGHLRMCRDGYLKNGLPTVVCMIATKKPDSKHPFSNDLIQRELEIVSEKYPEILDVILVNRADIVETGQALHDHGYEPKLWLCGDDRVQKYRQQAKNQKYHTDGYLPDDFDVYTGTGRIEGVSATEVRNALRSNDYHKFIELMPKGTDKMFNMFRDELLKVTETQHISLSDYLVESLVLEGGMGGHMPHPIDFEDFTGDDLKDLVRQLFEGKIEHMKEKLDGTNINAYMNPAGTVVFIRNHGDLNSEAGGMTLQDMSVKWSDKPQVARTFVEAGKIIEQVFSLLPKTFFNPSPDRKRIVNCECITAGQTNVMIYTSDRVAFHGTSEYTLADGKWTLTKVTEGIPDELSKAAEQVTGAEQRPDLIIKSVEEGSKLADMFCKEIDKLFKDEGLDTSATVDGWKMKRFSERCPEWLVPEDVYRRWFYQDKSVNMNLLKKKYIEKSAELKQLDIKEYKSIVSETIKPLDRLFLKIGNALIDCLSGFTNQDKSYEVSNELRSQLEALVKSLRNSKDIDIEKLDSQIERLQEIGDTINSAEGVVFTYRGRVMKLTGSFSALNQIMGMERFDR